MEALPEANGHAGKSCLLRNSLRPANGQQFAFRRDKVELHYPTMFAGACGRALLA